MTDSKDTLARLAAVIESRRAGDPEKSYVARLFAKGPDAVLKKIGEEATETVMAAKDGEPGRIVHETADLWFHCLVMLQREGIAVSERFSSVISTCRPAFVSEKVCSAT